jgi:serine/threonine protein kinase
MLRPYNRAELTFEFLDRIGKEGRNSIVYRAFDQQLQTQLAIKQISKQKLGDSAEYFRESAILHLSSHPNVVPIHYACEDADHVYLAMPYYLKGSLSDLLAKRYLSVREIVRLSTHFLSALHNIHTKGLIHFDVKPGNILLSSRDEALLSDFGLAKQTAYNGEAGNDRIYGPIAPPEYFGRARGFTSAFDIYQAGLTIYRMCVGNAEFYRQFQSYGPQQSFERERFRFDVRTGKFPDRSSYPEHIPERLRRLVKKCLDPSPSNRPTAALHVINDLSDIDGKILDWQYELFGDGARIWRKAQDGREIRLAVGLNDQAVAVTVAESGAERRIREYCRQLTSREVRTFLESY